MGCLGQVLCPQGLKWPLLVPALKEPSSLIIACSHVANLGQTGWEQLAPAVFQLWAHWAAGVLVTSWLFCVFVCLLVWFFLPFLKNIYLFERVGEEGKREVSIHLFTLQMMQQLGLCQPKLKAKSFFQVSRMGAGGKGLGPFFHCFPWYISWLGSGAAGACYRWWSNPLFHSTDSLPRSSQCGD